MSDGKRRIEIYDTTLRDGTQAEGVTLSLTDKLKIAQFLDEMGVDYIEGGYPLSNPKDVAFFEEAARIEWKHARVVAFGMTRRAGLAAADDPGMRALVGAGAPVITVVGKTWDLHVDEVLRISRDENLAMIRDSVAFLKAAPHVEAVFYDAEHFFDGYEANPAYACETVQAALDAGADRIVLCDTNGGSLPGRIERVMDDLFTRLGSRNGGLEARLGVHPHNDSGCAVANALAAVRRGCVQVQGTINGIGERCGNVDLTTVIANLRLKLNMDCLLPGDAALGRLTELSRFVYELANLNPAPGQPYVGSGAFAHKGGMHVHAVQRISHSYEHVSPESVGNARRVLMSELGGASGVLATLGSKFDLAGDKAKQRKIIERVAELENQGYQFETALASLELLVHDVLGSRPRFWELDHYRCVIYKRDGETPSTEAIVKLKLNGAVEHRVAEGDGPVNALDGAMRRCLKNHFPQIHGIHLTDFKVRVVNPNAESAATVRVIAEFAARGADGMLRRFSTIGVDENVVDASWRAITDAFAYHLMETGAKP